MECNYKDLTDEERLALVGLIKVVIQADRLYSKEEDAELKRIAGEIGEELFIATVDEARERFKTLDAIKEYARTVERQEARELILSTVQEMAVSDEVSPEEAQMVDWLSELWGF